MIKKRKYTHRIHAVPGSFRRLSMDDIDRLNRHHGWRKKGSGLTKGCRLQKEKECSDYVFSSAERKNILAAEEYGYWDAMSDPAQLCDGNSVFIFPTNEVRDYCHKNKKEVFGWEFEVDFVEEITEETYKSWWGDSDHYDELFDDYEELCSENEELTDKLNKLRDLLIRQHEAVKTLIEV